MRLVLKRYRGTCPVYLSVRDANGKQVQLKLNDEFRVNPAALKVEELEMLLGTGGGAVQPVRRGAVVNPIGSG